LCLPLWETPAAPARALVCASARVTAPAVVGRALQDTALEHRRMCSAAQTSFATTIRASACRRRRAQGPGLLLTGSVPEVLGSLAAVTSSVMEDRGLARRHLHAVGL